MPTENKQPVVVIALVTAVCLLGDSMLYVVLPVHWKDVGLSSLWEVGILLSINRLIRLPLNPLIGWLYQRISKRNGILMAVLLAAITTISYGFNKVFWVWVIMRAVWGIAWSLLRLGGYFTILDLSHDQNRGRLMGTFTGLYRLGSLGGMLVGAFAVDIYGIHVIAIIFGFLTLLALPFVMKYVLPKQIDHPLHPIQELPKPFSIWKRYDVLVTLLSGLLLAMIFQGMFTATVSHVIQEYASSDKINFFTFTIGVASVSGILQSLRWGWEPWLAPIIGKVSDGKRGRIPLFVVFLALSSCLFALVPFHFPFSWWITILILIQLTATALNTVMDAITSDVAIHTSKVAMMTTYTMVTDLGAAIGPSLSYLVISIWGTNYVYWGTAAILFFMFANWYISYSHAKLITPS